MKTKKPSKTLKKFSVDILKKEYGRYVKDRIIGDMNFEGWLLKNNSLFAPIKVIRVEFNRANLLKF